MRVSRGTVAVLPMGIGGAVIIGYWYLRFVQQSPVRWIGGFPLLGLVLISIGSFLLTRTD